MRSHALSNEVLQRSCRLGSILARPQRCAPDSSNAVNAVAMENGQAPFNAIEMGRIAEVEAWLDNGGDPTMFSDIEPDRSLLRCAARRGRAEIISLLLSRGADIDATDADGRTAVYEMLNHWTRHSSLPALRLLLSHGADVNLARTNGGFLSGRSPLMIASNEQGPDIIRLLLRAGADPEPVSYTHLTLPTKA